MAEAKDLSLSSVDQLPEIRTEPKLVSENQSGCQLGDDNEDDKQVDELDKTERVLSKNEQKRIKKREKWLEAKSEKRKKEKEKRKRKIAEARAKGETLGPTRKSLKDNSMRNSLCKIRVVIDCYFDLYMGDKDTMKLVKQIQHCYSVNRRSPNPLQFYVCCSEGKTKDRLDRIGDYKNWDMNFHESPYWEVFNKGEIIYLTSDSPNLLTELDPNKAYIIGGLVDHNHEKGLCHQLAEERGFQHAQLPIGEYVKLNSRKVLTVNHVFEILLRYTETKDWDTAFHQVIPLRKTVSNSHTSNSREKQNPKVNIDNDIKIEGDENSDLNAGAGINETIIQDKNITHEGDNTGNNDEKVDNSINNHDVNDIKNSDDDIKKAVDDIKKAVDDIKNDADDIKNDDDDIKNDDIDKTVSDT